MALSDLLAADRSTIFSTSDFGESVTYIAPDGVTTTLTAIVFPERNEDVEQRGIIQRKRFRFLHINRSDLTDVNQNATIKIGTVEYAISSMSYQDDYVTTVELARYELAEQARPGYRNQK